MKARLFVSLILCYVLMLPPAPLKAEIPINLFGTAGTTVTGLSAAYSAAAFRRCYVRIKSVAGSTSQVLIKGNDTNDQTSFQLLGTISNPTANGEYWGGTCPAFIWVDVSTGPAGTILATLDRRDSIGS